MKRFLLSLVSISLVAALPLSAGDAKKPAAAAPPDEKAMMEAWQKAATPNENHKKLDPVIGTFDAKVTNWMAPGAPPMESTGVSENKWARGGRYVEVHFDGTFMGMPFSGIGYTGYDNIKKEYVSTWMDNMSTTVMMARGNVEKNGDMTLSGSMPDPMTGKATPFTEKMKIIDNDHNVWEMWGPGPDGKNFKMMEITYSRKQ